MTQPAGRRRSQFIDAVIDERNSAFHRARR